MRRFVVLASVLLLLGACTKTLPIYNVENAEIFTGSGKEPTREQVREAIAQAVVAKTWQLKEIDASHIEASLSKKNKIARVLIEFSTKKYSINYKFSSQLLYKDGSIHRRYNSWIRGLQIKINQNLAQL